MDFLSKNIEETAKIAANFASKLVNNADMATIIGLYGELGSGKTTFMKYLAESFGVEETIQSPTFVIMRIYKTSPLRDTSFSSSPLLGKERGQGGEVFEHLIHIDAYRIEKESEMINLGWNEIIADSKNLICIEWPERIAGIMPEHIKIYFEHISESERKIRIELPVVNNIKK